MAIWNRILDAFQTALAGLHDLFEPLAGIHAWGFAIIALTVIVRLLLLPLGIKQVRSMRAMQALQPQMKELQKKYKVDRELMKKDPEQYRAKRQKLNEEMMALYQREGVNPAASCLPLIAQAPIFIALFNVLRGDRAAELANQPFYFFTSFISAPETGDPTGLGALVSRAGWPGWLLIVLMGLTMFISQKQIMARQSAMGADNPMAQQQKILLYVMPVFLAVISFNLPLGVLLYWVTTNIFQATQQWFMLRDVKVPNAAAATDGKSDGKSGGETAAHNPSASSGTPGKGGASSGKGSATSGKGGASSGKGGASSGARSGDGGTTSSGNGRSSSPTTGGGGRKKGSGAGGSGGSGPARPSPGGRRSDHIPRRGGGRP